MYSFTLYKIYGSRFLTFANVLEYSELIYHFMVDDIELQLTYGYINKILSKKRIESFFKIV